MCGKWDAKNNPQDYGIAQNLGSGLKNPIGDPLYRGQNLSFSRYFLMNPRKKRKYLLTAV